MMVAFFSIFPFCGLIVGWIICLFVVYSFCAKEKGYHELFYRNQSPFTRIFYSVYNATDHYKR